MTAVRNTGNGVGTLPHDKAGLTGDGAGAVKRRRLRNKAISNNVREARSIWGPLHQTVLKNLQQLTKSHHLSVAAGDFAMLDNRIYVTHSGLLRIGERRRCSGIVTLSAKGYIRSKCGPVGLQGDRLYEFRLERLRWIWGRRSFQRFRARSRSRDAHCGNPSSEPSTPQSIWHRNLLRRGVGLFSVD